MRHSDPHPASRFAIERGRTTTAASLDDGRHATRREGSAVHRDGRVRLTALPLVGLRDRVAIRSGGGGGQSVTADS